MDPDNLITDELVSAALSKDKGKTAKLVSWSQESATKSGSINKYFSVIKRIRIKYIEDEMEKFTSYISKINPCNPDDSFNPYRQRAVLKEVFFYETLLPLLNAELHKMGERPLKVPKYLHSCTDEGREVIILEDLDLKGFEISDSKYPVDDSHSKVMVTELSRFHAAGLALQKNYTEDLGEVFPLLTESWQCPELNFGEAFDKVFQKGMLLNISLIKALGGYQDLLPWLESLTKRVMKTIKKEMEVTAPWRGLCHGDYHRINVLFKYDEKRNPIDIMLLDWQNVRMSHISSDIAYLVYSSYNHSLRENSFSVSVNTYTEKFRQIFETGMFFKAEELLKEADSNQFSILLCFYVIPLSLCVTDFSELFHISPDYFINYNSEEADIKAQYFLKHIPFLSNVLRDYLEEMRRKNLHITH